MNFIGTECLVCKEKFIEDDDIVVCEVCGTPYHRECYFKRGKCINTEYHDNGWTFNQRHATPSEVLESNGTIPPVTVESIHHKANIDERYSRMIDMSKDLLSQSKLDPNQEVFGVTLLEFYLYTKSLSDTRRFYKSRNGEPINSLFVILFPELYAVSKRLYVPATFILLIEFIIAIPFMVNSYPYNLYGQLTSLFPDSVSQLLQSMPWVCLIVLFLFKVYVADKCIGLYLKDCTKNIRSIKKDSKLKNQTQNMLHKRLLGVKSSINISAMLALIVGSLSMYCNLYLILILLVAFFGG